jgi:hypothetical protein
LLKKALVTSMVNKNAIPAVWLNTRKLQFYRHSQFCFEEGKILINARPEDGLFFVPDSEENEFRVVQGHLLKKK